MKKIFIDKSKFSCNKNIFLNWMNVRVRFFKFWKRVKIQKNSNFNEIDTLKNNIDSFKK